MIEPLDCARCQAEITVNVNASNFMTMGGKIGGTSRCTNAPTAVLTEREPGADGQKGHMTVCASCLEVFKKKNPRHEETVEVSQIRQTRRFVLDHPSPLELERQSSHAFSPLAATFAIEAYCGRCGTPFSKAHEHACKAEKK